MIRPPFRLTPASLISLVLILAILAIALLQQPFVAILLLLAALAVSMLGSARLLAQQRRRHGLAEATLEAMADAVIRFDPDGRFQYLNPAASRLIGLSPREAGQRKLDQAFSLIAQENRHPITPVLCEETQRGHVTDLGIDAILLTNEKMEVRVEGQCAPIFSRSGDPSGGILVMRDVTEIRELQRKEAWLAEHDALTGTLNRKAFENRLARSIHSKRASEYPMSLLYVEASTYPRVLDAVGQAAANELLVQVARIIQARIRDSDPIGRHGESAFAILLPACPLPSAERLGQIAYDNLTSHRFQWGPHEHALGISLGIVHIQPDWETLDHVIAAAQTACALSGTRPGVAVYRE